jgi:hypothetical protein
MTSEYNTLFLVLLLSCFAYCIIKINNLEKQYIENFTTDTKATKNIKIGNWYIADRGDGLGFYANNNLNDLRYFMWSNNNKGIWTIQGPTVLYDPTALEGNHATISLGSNAFIWQKDGDIGIAHGSGSSIHKIWMNNEGLLLAKDGWYENRRVAQQ